MSTQTTANSEGTLHGYRYRTPQENLLAPVATAASFPWLREQFGPAWLFGILPRVISAKLQSAAKRLRFAFQRLTFRFEKTAAYEQLFPRGALPEFASERGASDAAFSFYRIAAPSPMLLRREPSLAALLARIPLDVWRTEQRFHTRAVDLAQAAERGHLFSVDHAAIRGAFGDGRVRDSRWRGKYLPAPLAVFLELPGFLPGCDLVPLAIRIDATDAHGHNPVYTPDDADGWRLAKAYFEVADSNFQLMAAHTGRVHMGLDAFCMATGRRLSETHPISVLLRPHLRFTLAAASAAYGDYTKPGSEFDTAYAGTLSDDRAMLTADIAERTFRDFAPLCDFTWRGVETAPVDYPFRDDALLWVDALERFTRSYVVAYFADDAAVARDVELQAWANELVDPHQGNVRGLFEHDRLETREQLGDVLAQLLFMAGPYHASQHFGGNYYYRFAPVFPCEALSPPPLAGERPSFATWLALLPGIDAARTQFAVNTLSNYQYERFGDYRRYALGKAPLAQPAIERLHRDLAGIEREISERASKRMFRSDFMKPSLVPNSANI